MYQSENLLKIVIDICTKVYANLSFSGFLENLFLYLCRNTCLRNYNSQSAETVYSCYAQHIVQTTPTSKKIKTFLKNTQKAVFIDFCLFIYYNLNTIQVRILGGKTIVKLSAIVIELMCSFISKEEQNGNTLIIDVSPVYIRGLFLK